MSTGITDIYLITIIIIILSRERMSNQTLSRLQQRKSTSYTVDLATPHRRLSVSRFKYSSESEIVREGQ